MSQLQSVGKSVERGELIQRIPPQDLEAERSILGGILLQNESFYVVMNILQRTDFYAENHQIIFGGMEELARKSYPIDLVTLHNTLDAKNKLETVGGYAYLIRLANMVPSAANIEYYARLVKDKAMLRKLIHASEEIVHNAYSEGEDANVILDAAERNIFAIGQARVTRDFSHIGAIINPTLKNLERVYHNKEQIMGVPTGYYDLDAMLNGFNPTDLIILAARPSMGKTTLLLNIAEKVAIGNKMGVGLFSLEMSKEQLVTRILASQSRVDATKIRSGHLSQEEWQTLALTAAHIETAPIYIDDTPAISPLQLKGKVRRLATQTDLKIIMIDYIQLMKGNTANKEGREKEISEISRSLKEIAKEMNVPVICLSQLNRKAEERNDKRPMLSDLRESGAIEQDADVVMFIYRDEVYNKESPEAGVAEIIIGKQRNGPIGTVKLAFLRQFNCFESFTPDDPRSGTFMG